MRAEQHQLKNNPLKVQKKSLQGLLEVAVEPHVDVQAASLEDLYVAFLLHRPRVGTGKRSTHVGMHEKIWQQRRSLGGSSQGVQCELFLGRIDSHEQTTSCMCSLAYNFHARHDGTT